MESIVGSLQDLQLQLQWSSEVIQLIPLGSGQSSLDLDNLVVYECHLVAGSVDLLFSSGELTSRCDGLDGDF